MKVVEQTMTHAPWPLFDHVPELSSHPERLHIPRIETLCSLTTSNRGLQYVSVGWSYREVRSDQRDGGKDRFIQVDNLLLSRPRGRYMHRITPL